MHVIGNDKLASHKCATGSQATNLLLICDKLTMAKKMAACTFYQNASRTSSKNDGKKMPKETAART